MNIQNQTDDNELAKLIAYAETYDYLDSALDDAYSAIGDALDALENAQARFEVARDEAGEQNDRDAYSELDELCARIESTHSDLENVTVPDTFLFRATCLRIDLEQQHAASGTTAPAVSQE